LALWCQTW